MWFSRRHGIIAAYFCSWQNWTKKALKLDQIIYWLKAKNLNGRPKYIFILTLNNKAIKLIKLMILNANFLLLKFYCFFKVFIIIIKSNPDFHIKPIKIIEITLKIVQFTEISISGQRSGKLNCYQRCEENKRVLFKIVWLIWDILFLFNFCFISKFYK